MSIAEKPTAAFILSFVAGVLTLAGSVLAISWALTVPAWKGSWFDMMCWGMMWNWGLVRWHLGMSVFSFISGLIMLIGAYMLYSQPYQGQIWGTVILVFSLLSLFGMSFFIGAILGIVGGILALTWKPASQ